MELVKVLHMAGGDGQSSYAQNSLLQQKAITMTKPTREEAINKLHNSFPTARCIAIAELGCSSGPNALLTVHELAIGIKKVRQQLENHLPVCIQAFLNDLLGNDFNSVFKELPSFNKKLKEEIGEGFGGCFVYGAPGSFYGWLFESQSLHFVHSSNSLHWLSQIPKRIESRTRSNSRVAISVDEAYYEQFQIDLTAFLRCRSEELVKGGCLVFTLAGRSDDPSIKRSDYVSELLLLTLKQMIFEGLIGEAALAILKSPIYSPSPAEIEIGVKKEGSFEINQLQVWELEWGAVAPDDCAINEEDKVGRMTSMMRSVAESLLSQYFDQAMRDEIFRRYAQVIRDCMAKERCFFTNITVSLTKNI